jgi:hypothetical protein
VKGVVFLNVLVVACKLCGLLGSAVVSAVSLYVVRSKPCYLEIR